MAGQRNPKVILISLIGCVVLFLVFVGISRLNVFERHAYTPAFGWDKPAPTTPNPLAGACVPTTDSNGFPLVYSRQDVADNCQKDKNSIAKAINLAACFALATLIAVGVTEGVKSR